MSLTSLVRFALVAAIFGPVASAWAEVGKCVPNLEAPIAVADFTKYAVIHFNDATERRAKCAELVPLMIDARLVQTRPDLVLRLLDNVCDQETESRRRLVTAALAVVDDLPDHAYADVVNGESIHRQDVRARAVRGFLRQILREGHMSAEDWRAILARIPARHVLPVLAAMTPRAKWFERARPATESWLAGLRLHQTERIELAGRLLSEQFPLNAVMRWTDLRSPALLDKFLDVMTPLQWLEYQLEVGPRDESVLLEIESRAPAFTKAEPPRGDVRGPITRLMTTPEISINIASRVIAALNDQWSTWYGASPMLPDRHTITGRRRFKDRLDVFYTRSNESPKRAAQVSRTATRLLRAQLPLILRRAPGARRLRWVLESYFPERAPHGDDHGAVHASIFKALKHTLPQLDHADDWIHLVETQIPHGTGERHRVFVSSRLHDLIRSGDAALDFLDQAKFTRPYLKSLGSDDEASLLGQLRAFRDEVPRLARTEAELNRRAIERLLDPDLGVDALLLSLGDVRAIAASRDTGTWSAEGLPLRNYDIRPALLGHRRRAMVTYLRGRCSRGATPRVDVSRVPELGRVIADEGLDLEVVHVNSMGHAYVRISAKR